MAPVSHLPPLLRKHMPHEKSLAILRSESNDALYERLHDIREKHLRKCDYIEKQEGDKVLKRIAIFLNDEYSTDDEYNDAVDRIVWNKNNSKPIDSSSSCSSSTSSSSRNK